MIVLLDIALALMVLAGALFIGATALTIFKEANKKDSRDDE